MSGKVVETKNKRPSRLVSANKKAIKKSTESVNKKAIEKSNSSANNKMTISSKEKAMSKKETYLINYLKESISKIPKKYLTKTELEFKHPQDFTIIVEVKRITKAK